MLAALGIALPAVGGLGLGRFGPGFMQGMGRSVPWLGSYFATFGQSYGAGQQLSREWLAFSMDRDEWFRNQRNVQPWGNIGYDEQWNEAYYGAALGLSDVEELRYEW